MTNNGRIAFEAQLITALVGCPTEVDAVERLYGVTPATFTLRTLAGAYDTIVRSYDDYHQRPTMGNVITNLRAVMDPQAFDVLASTFHETTPEEVSDAVARLRRYDKDNDPDDQEQEEPKQKASRPTAAPVADYQPFPTDCLPQDVRRFIIEASKSIGCDHAYVALPLLTALGAAIGNSRRLVVKRTWYAPPTIWTAIVGESGTAKSPAMKEAVLPIKKLQGEALKVYAEELKDYEAAMLAYERDVAAFKRDKSGNVDAPAKPEHPHPQRLMVQNTTVEALAPILVHNPKGLLLCRDELAGWFGSFNRYSGKKGADEADWMSMCDGDSITVDRKGDGTAPLHVPSALLSITGGIQPATLKESLSPQHRSSGLAARILMAQPPRIAARWTDEELSVVAIELMTELFKGLVALEMLEDEEGHLQSQYIGMTESAKQRWKAYFNEHQAEQVDLIGDEASAWSKLLAYVPRFALLIHLVRQVSGESVHDQVDADSMETAITLTDWFKAESARVYGALDDDAAIAGLRQIAEWIKRKHDGEVTVRDLTRGKVQRITTAEDAESKLNELAKAGLGEWDSTDRKKRVFRTY